MSEKFKGSHLNDEELEKQLVELFKGDIDREGANFQRYVEFVLFLRDGAYSVGYRHGYQDKRTGH